MDLGIKIRIVYSCNNFPWTLSSGDTGLSGEIILAVAPGNVGTISSVLAIRQCLTPLLFNSLANGLVERQDIFRYLPKYYAFVRSNDVQYPDRLTITYLCDRR